MDAGEVVDLYALARMASDKPKILRLPSERIPKWFLSPSTLLYESNCAKVLKEVFLQVSIVLS